MKLKDKFVGTGSMKGFVKESNKLFSSLNNIEFILPTGYSGIEPTIRLEEDGLVFDFGDALIFTLNNVGWKLTGDATFVSNKVEVVNGKLVISVKAMT